MKRLIFVTAITLFLAATSWSQSNDLEGFSVSNPEQNTDSETNNYLEIQRNRPEPARPQPAHYGLTFENKVPFVDVLRAGADEKWLVLYLTRSENSGMFIYTGARGSGVGESIVIGEQVSVTN